MSIISIISWKGLTEEQKSNWIIKCTDIISNILNEPLDEIIVYINEIDKGNWGQAGAIGTDKDWLTKSIRKSNNKGD